jgi:hypothetical protein
MKQEQRERAIAHLKGTLQNEADRLLFEMLMEGQEPAYKPVEVKVAGEELSKVVTHGTPPPVVLTPIVTPKPSATAKRPYKTSYISRDKRYPWQALIVAALGDDDRDGAQLLLWEHDPKARISLFKRWHKPLIEKFKALAPGEPRMAFLKREYGFERHNLPLNGTVPR